MCQIKTEYNRKSIYQTKFPKDVSDGQFHLKRQKVCEVRQTVGTRKHGPVD